MKSNYISLSFLSLLFLALVFALAWPSLSLAVEVDTESDVVITDDVVITLEEEVFEDETDEDEEVVTEEETADQDTIEELLEKIAQLQAQVNQLTTTVAGQDTEIRELREFTRNLALGVQGDDVRDLQEYLAQDPEIYPEGLVTGYYGPLTREAVRRWQAFYGIDSVGVFGPVTRETFNARRMADRRVSADSLTADTQASNLSLDTEAVSPQDAPPGQTKAEFCHIPPGNPANARTIVVGGPALSALPGHPGSCESDQDSSDHDLDDEEEEEDLDDEDGEAEAEMEVEDETDLIDEE